MSSETLAAIGALLGALGALIPQLSSWLRDRSQLGVERRKMDLVSSEIDLISKWLAATAQFSSEAMEARRADAELRLIDLLQFSEHIVVPEDTRQVESARPGLVQNLLFYAYSGFFLFLVLGASIDDTTKNPSFTALFTGENTGLLTVFAVPLGVLYVIRRKSKKVRGM